MKTQNSQYEKYTFVVLGIITSFLFYSCYINSSEPGTYNQTVFDINTWLQEENLLTCQIEDTSIHTEIEPSKSNPKKPWTIIIYLAADNDLGPFAVRNIKQMANIGSTKNINILIHLDIKTIDKKKVTRRFYVEQNKLTQVNINDPLTQKMNSGDPQTLISCVKWAVHDYPAHNIALILWNHGTGPLDPLTGKTFNANELFSYNSTTNKLDLDRSIGFLEYINILEYLNQLEKRGICWDDSTGSYLTNQKLDFALKTICNDCLNGKKISLLGFDACLMNTIEIASSVKKYADVMVGSQEVVLGSGWNYQNVLAPFGQGSFDAPSFARHIVTAYDSAYHSVTNDYTLAAVSLDKVETLEDNINIVASLLIECLQKQVQGSVKKAIQASRNKHVCTHFEEPSYIDIHHFYRNMLSNINQFKLKNATDEQNLKVQLKKELEYGQQIIENIVIANKVGSNLKNATGISIYFPEQRIHASYKKTMFAANNRWLSFIATYIMA